jgi:uncharacterized protein
MFNSHSQAMQATIAQLWVYPIKGCAGTRLQTAQALPTGLQYDRCMMVVDAVTGRFISQRSHPKMALIKPLIQGGELHLSGLGLASLSLPTQSSTQTKTVTVWGDTLPAIDMGDEAAVWFSTALAAQVRLVRFDPAQIRAVKCVAHQTHLFADGYPYLVLSKASLRVLNERLLANGAAIIGADRFRANIIIDDVDAHTEDFAASMIHPSGAVLTMAAPCTRCQVPTIDQMTGVADAQHEPTMTLNAYRYDSAEDGVTFGMNATVNAAFKLTEADVLGIELVF